MSGWLRFRVRYLKTGVSQITNQVPASRQLRSVTSCLLPSFPIFSTAWRFRWVKNHCGGWFPLIKYHYFTVNYYLLPKHDTISSDLRNVLRCIFLPLWRQKKRKINMWKETWKIEGFHGAIGKRNNSKRSLKFTGIWPRAEWTRKVTLL